MLLVIPLEVGSSLLWIECALGTLVSLQYLSSGPGRATLLAVDSNPVGKCLCSDPEKETS